MSEFDYDLIVIGGGSGGMAAAKAAAAHGARVALFDYVKPSTQGSTWGIGGTCVNVGCVPKKLMHYAAGLGVGLHDAEVMGWKVDTSAKHDWSELVDTVRNHIQMLNFRYGGGLRKKDVTYINALASFTVGDKHRIVYKEDGLDKSLRAKNIIIATGGRPIVPSDIPGAVEHAITSDDLFYLKKAPGKTLCVGASYIALECAGFLTELGYDTTVAIRSIPLRGFDRQCAKKVVEIMEEMGTRFQHNVDVLEIGRLPSGRFQVALLNKTTNEETSEVFDTVFFATGRYADLSGLNLSSVGVEVDAKTGKIPVIKDATNVPHIFAIGDICLGTPELTPVAIKAGELLSNRLFANATKTLDYTMIPTTVFTPIEYATVGLTEEAAIAKYGEDDIEVYLSEFTTLEVSAIHRQKHPRLGGDMSHNCLSKLICVKSQQERVVGWHFVGPNAGEICQGFALAVKMGARKEDFDDLMSIHPTDAESFCQLSITKSSGVDFAAGGGCGGGVCG